ncbi:flagellar assembly protein FliH [Pseudogracilibacillus sp. SE30717A]|uniref:flagellar assembly protein FliH n=1 Tax=Pseudogracilibacillus sp. SE30717A TaxID=3098293 RepID=UPI00300E52F3
MSKIINEKNPLNHKVISLKKVAALQKEQISTTDKNAEEKYISLQMKVENTKRQLASLEHQKEKLLHDLKEAIDKEKRDWQIQKNKEQELAKQTGYKIGFDEGQEKAVSTYQSQIEEANKIVESATNDYHRTVAKYELTIIQLAISAAEKIIRKKIDKKPENFTSMVREAIEDLKDKSQVTIYVHPEDYQFILKQKEELEQLLEDGELLSIYMDQQLNSGDCTIKHPFGQMDVGIDSQLQQIRLALEEKISEKL